jgi:hypothetical protein
MRVLILVIRGLGEFLECFFYWFSHGMSHHGLTEYGNPLAPYAKGARNMYYTSIPLRGQSRKKHGARHSCLAGQVTRSPHAGRP